MLSAISFRPIQITSFGMKAMDNASSSNLEQDESKKEKSIPQIAEEYVNLIIDYCEDEESDPEKLRKIMAFPRANNFIQIGADKKKNEEFVSSIQAKLGELKSTKPEVRERLVERYYETHIFIPHNVRF